MLFFKEHRMIICVEKIANLGLILSFIDKLLIRMLWNRGNFWLFVCLCIFSELGMALAVGVVK